METRVPAHQLLGNTDLVARCCSHCNVDTYLMLSPGVGAMLKIRIAAPESELKPGAVCTASRLAPPSFLLTAPASSCYGNIHSQGCSQKCLGKTAPRLTPSAVDNPPGLSLGLCTFKHLHVLSDQISGHTIHSPWFYAVGKPSWWAATQPEHRFR